MKFLRGIVVDNNDTTKSGRVKVRIFEIHGIKNTETTSNEESAASVVPDKDLPWCEVMQPIDFIGYNSQTPQDAESFAKSIDGSGSKSGSKTITHSGKKPGAGYNRILAKGTWVFCVLDNDNPNYPIVIGTIASKGEYTPSSAQRVYDSQTGLYEEFNDNGTIIIHNKDASEIVMDSAGFHLNSSGKLNQYSKADFNIHADSNMNSYVGANAKTTIKGNAESQITGNSTLKTDGNLINTIQGNTEIKAQGNFNAEGSMVNLKSNGTIAVKGSMIMLN